MMGPDLQVTPKYSLCIRKQVWVCVCVCVCVCVREREREEWVVGGKTEKFKTASKTCNF